MTAAKFLSVFSSDWARKSGLHFLLLRLVSGVVGFFPFEILRAHASLGEGILGGVVDGATTASATRLNDRRVNFFQ